METNYSVLFYLKKQKDWSKSPAPIYMRITINGKLLNTYLDEWVAMPSLIAWKFKIGANQYTVSYPAVIA